MPQVHLYDQAGIGALDWPATVDGDYARRYLLPFIQAGPSAYIANVQTQMAVLRVDDVLLQPLFGYATNLPQALGLYRLLSTQTALEGIQHHRLIHCSAGVGEFKRLRGAVPAIEYNAVYYHHLPKARQTPWCILKILLDRLAIPVIQKYGF